MYSTRTENVFYIGLLRGLEPRGLRLYGLTRLTVARKASSFSAPRKILQGNISKNHILIHPKYIPGMRWFAYDINLIYELRIKNRSESDIRSCEVKQFAKKVQKKILSIQRDSNPWPSRCMCDALPTELWSLVGNKSRAISIYKRVKWCVYDIYNMCALRIENTSSESGLRSCEALSSCNESPEKNSEATLFI